MFLRLLDIEWRKLLRHPLMWLELAGLIGILTAYFAVRYALISSSAQHGVPDTHSLAVDLQDGLELFSFMSVAFYAAGAALIVGYDFPERGVQAWLARGVPRQLLIAARLVMVLLLGLLLVAAAAFASLAAAALASRLFLGSLTPDIAWSRVFATILHMFWGAVPYLAMTLLLAVISRSPLFAASGAVVFRTVLENLLLNLSDRFPDLVRLLPTQLAFVLQLDTCALERASQAMAPVQALLTEQQAAMMIAGLLLLFTAAAALTFSRQDWGG